MAAKLLFGLHSSHMPSMASHSSHMPRSLSEEWGLHMPSTSDMPSIGGFICQALLIDF
jgi:hypothetical protein